MQTNLVERLGQVSSSALVSHRPVGSMSREELLLVLHRVGHGKVGVDVLLRSIDDSDEAEFERVDSTGEDIGSVGSSVHEIELGEDSDGSKASRINGTSELEGIRVGEVDVGWRDGEDDAAIEEKKG